MSATTRASDDEIGAASASAERAGALPAAVTAGGAEPAGMQLLHSTASGDVTTAEQQPHAGKLPK